VQRLNAEMERTASAEITEEHVLTTAESVGGLTNCPFYSVTAGVVFSVRAVTINLLSSGKRLQAADRACVEMVY